MKKQRPFPLFSLLSAALLYHLQPIPTANSDPNTDFIRTSCGTTLYPDLCYISLSGYANAVQQDPAKLAGVAIGVSLSVARDMAGYLSDISGQADNGVDPRAAAALRDCITVFGGAVGQIRGSFKQMQQLGSGSELQFQLSNLQTWMSAALTNEDTCTDGFKDVPGGAVKTDVCDRVVEVKVKEVTSNALALVNSYASKVTTP